MSKFVEVNEKIAEKVVEGYKKIEDGVVEGYKKIETGAVEGFNKVNDRTPGKAYCRCGRKNYSGRLYGTSKTAKQIRHG